MKSISSILVIEDNNTSLTIISELFKAMDVKTVSKAPTAEDAIKLLETNKYTCIISDYRLPGMDGVQFLEQLRAKGDMTPVCMLSGAPDKGGVVRATNLPNVDFLGKPFKTAELLAALEKLLAKSAA